MSGMPSRAMVADSSRLTELAIEASDEVSGVSFCLAHMSFLRCSWCSMPIESMRSDSRSSARNPPSTWIVVSSVVLIVRRKEGWRQRCEVTRAFFSEWDRHGHVYDDEHDEVFLAEEAAVHGCTRS